MAELASDVELMLRVKRGDREAFAVLVHRYRKPLINFIYRFTPNRGECEDLTQEVLLKIFQAAPRYKPSASLSSWIYRIATNLALNHVRGHKPLSAISLDDGSEGEDGRTSIDIKDPEKPAEDRLIERERTSTIRKALADLPENQRLAVILTKYQDLSLKEAANVLRCSEAAVKSLIFRAYSALREKLLPALESSQVGECKLRNN